VAGKKRVSFPKPCMYVYVVFRVQRVAHVCNGTQMSLGKAASSGKLMAGFS